LALPAMLFSPIGTRLIYGQFEKGMVYFTIDEAKKIYAKKLLERFSNDKV
jgi:uncharacterized protein (UPF0218 family)